MTVLSADFEDNPTGNGVATSFVFTFRCLEPEHVVVINVTDGITLVYGTDYTATINTNGVGGTVTLGVAPGNGDQLRIYRDVPTTQETDFISEGNLDAEVIEDGLDKLTMLIQEQDARFSDILDQLEVTLQIDDADDIVIGGIPVFIEDDDDDQVLMGVIVPVQAGYVLTDNGVGELPTFQPINIVSLGNVSVPGTTDLNGIPFWAATDGTALGTIPPGTAGDILTSNGSASPPSFQANNADSDLFGYAVMRWIPDISTSGATHVFLASGGITLTASTPKVTSGGTACNVIEYTATTTGADAGVSSDLSTNGITTTAALNQHIKFHARVIVAANGTAHNFFIGLVDDVSDQQAQGDSSGIAVAGFRYASAVDTGNDNWRTVSNDGNVGTELVFDTGIPSASAVQFHDFAIHVFSTSPALSSFVKFYIDGVLVNTVTNTARMIGPTVRMLINAHALENLAKDISIEHVSLAIS